MSPSDPWSWTVDELVTELCHDTALLRTIGYATEHYPDRAVLERQLRSQKINGYDFLTKFDVRTLRSELGLDDLAQRIVLVSLIESLRQRSRPHAQNAATMGVETLDLNRTHHEKFHGSGGVSARNLVNTLDSIGRKRQKVATVTSEPLRTAEEIPRAARNEWSHLLRWQETTSHDDDVDMANLDGLDEEAVYGGDESDEGETSDAQEDEEDDTEQSHQAQARCKLTHDDIVEIINDCISAYTNMWEPDAGVPKEERIVYEPEKMWEEAEAKGRRQQLVTNYEAEVDYYTQGLDTLCEEIIKVPGSTAGAIRRQCNNLEVTVNNLELAKWLLSIYALPPESDSDEDDGNVGNGGQIHSWNMEPQSTPVLHEDQYAADIVDLGSPLMSSKGDAEGASPSSHVSPKHASGYERNSPKIESTPSSQMFSPHAEVALTIEANTPLNSEALPLRHDLKSKSPINHGDNPEHASISTVRRWDWRDLIETQDRKRVITKAIYQLRAADREDIRSRLDLVGRAKLGREVKAYVDMLFRGESRIHGVLARDLLKIGMISKLFVSWWLCGDYFLETPARQQLEELVQCFEENSTDFNVFFDFVTTVMKTTFSDEALRHPERPSQAEIIEISDDEEMPTVSTATTHSTVAKRVPGSQQAFAIVLD